VTPRQVALAKIPVWVLCLAPLALLVSRGFGLGGTTLGANPVETVLLTIGKTGINLLLITLAVTPARRLLGINWLIRFRRLLGLFAFSYAVLHFLTYAVLDLQLQWSTLGVDIAKRPYITVGMLALLGMIPLAVTSTRAMQRRLGRRWLTLHKSIYGIAVLAIVHYLWQAKSDFEPEPLVYAGILATLLGYRIAHWWRRRRAVQPALRTAAPAPSRGGR
jgi:methionine sulfoxide reductase heme-binding subunit